MVADFQMCFAALSLSLASPTVEGSTLDFGVSRPTETASLTIGTAAMSVNGASPSEIQPLQTVGGLFLDQPFARSSGAMASCSVAVRVWLVLSAQRSSSAQRSRLKILLWSALRNLVALLRRLAVS